MGMVTGREGHFGVVSNGSCHHCGCNEKVLRAI